MDRFGRAVWPHVHRAGPSNDDHRGSARNRGARLRRTTHVRSDARRGRTVDGLPLSAFVIVALAVVAGTAAEIVFPGRGAYHTGWYNVALIALAILTLAAVRRRFRAAATPRARAAVVALTFGTVVVAVAGVASGLLGPDNQTIVGAPGQRIRVESLGVLSFPFADSATGAVDVMLERPL